MNSVLLNEIGDAERLAVEYCAKEFRPALIALFAFDARLGQIASKTTEPALGQMRLAWWRDMLSQPIDDRPKGDVVLEALSQHWAGYESSLIESVDAWEILIASETLTDDEVDSFANGRVTPLAKIGAQISEQTKEKAISLALPWALADIVPRVSDARERNIILENARGKLIENCRIAKTLRGLAVLHALARRSLMREGRPMIEGRGAALTALRVGLIGK